MFGVQAKIIAVLAVALFGAGMLIKHQLYAAGVSNERAKQIAASAARTIKAVKAVTKAKAESDRVADQGKREVADLRERHAAAVRDARAARRLAAESAASRPECPTPKEPVRCAPDLPLLQP